MRKHGRTYGIMDELQWGHVQSDVETAWWSKDITIKFWLQWGHVQSDVETT